MRGCARAPGVRPAAGRAATLPTRHRAIHSVIHSVILSAIHPAMYSAIHPAIHPAIHSAIYPDTHWVEVSLSCGDFQS